MRRLVVLLLSSAALCAAPAAAEKAHTGYPNSIAVIGHSGATGYNSDPARPGADALENSWATGANPSVNSVYQRILVGNPAIRGRNRNLARDGAKVNDMLAQAAAATTSAPRPELVLVQGIDNDIRCDGQDEARLPQFRKDFTRVLQTLSRGLPNARIFVVSQLGSYADYVSVISAVPEAREGITGDGPCDAFDSAGQVVAEHVAYLDHLSSIYEAQVAAACAEFVHCRYDGGAFKRLPVLLSDLSSDWNHLSVSGHARAAAAAWSAMFDFTDVTAPVSSAVRSGSTVTLAASDDIGVAGIEYKLTARKKKTAKWFTRYKAPLRVKKHWTLVWRAVDVNGNSEATHTLRG